MSEPLFLSLNDAVEMWLAATDCLAEAEHIEGDTADAMNIAFGEATKAGSISLSGIDAAKAHPRSHETIDPLYFTEHRTLWLPHNRIESWSTLQPIETCVRNMITERADRTWVDVQVSEPGFSQWISRLKAERQRRIDAFMKLERWGLLSTLLWIAIRDARTVFQLSQKSKSLHRVDIRISLRKAALQRSGDAEGAEQIVSLPIAWEKFLAPRMASGDISALATRVRLSRTSGIATNAPGVVFPEADSPGASLSFSLFDDDSQTSCVLKPNEHLFASAWAEYHDITLSRAEVMALWPAPVRVVAPTIRAERTGIPVNDRSVWTHAEAAAWLATGDASKDDPNTLSAHSDGEWGTSEAMAQGWERLLDKMAGGVLVAASSTCDGVSPAFWRHATITHELVDGELCDVFTRELEPVVVARTNGGGYAHSKREQHRNITLCSADVRATFPNLTEPLVKETGSVEAVPEPQAVPELATTDCETHDCENQPVGLIAVSRAWYRNPSDKILYDRVCELIAFDVTLAFETVLKEEAETLRMWPSDIVDQSRLIDRMKKRRARDKLEAEA